jgi:hypothetical protein
MFSSLSLQSNNHFVIWFTIHPFIKRRNIKLTSALTSALLLNELVEFYVTGFGGYGIAGCVTHLCA